MVTTTETNLRERALAAYRAAEDARAEARQREIDEAAANLRERLVMVMRLYFDVAVAPDEVVLLSNSDEVPTDAMIRSDDLYFSTLPWTNNLHVQPTCAHCRQEGGIVTFYRPTPAQNWETLGKFLAEFEAQGSRCDTCKAVAS